MFTDFARQLFNSLILIYVCHQLSPLIWRSDGIVQAAVMVMEDSEAFNAGRGSKLTVSFLKSEALLISICSTLSTNESSSRCLDTWRWMLPLWRGQVCKQELLLLLVALGILFN